MVLIAFHCIVLHYIDCTVVHSIVSCCSDRIAFTGQMGWPKRASVSSQRSFALYQHHQQQKTNKQKKTKQKTKQNKKTHTTECFSGRRQNKNSSPLTSVPVRRLGLQSRGRRRWPNKRTNKQTNENKSTKTTQSANNRTKKQQTKVWQ